ncbi:MAG: hypothetical protein WAT19_11975 [Ferruginibacter sp.]
MKYFIISFMLLCMNAATYCQQTPDRVLYGKITTDSLLQKPFESWYSKNYNSYSCNTSVKASLQKSLFRDVSIEVFFGSWCGDSRRELPRFIKLLDETGFDKFKLKIIAVGGSDSLYKQSPLNEQAGKGIYRVPTFIFYKQGKEIGRINEFPAVSLERDMQFILSGENYVPNYKTFNTVKKWQQEGALADTNVNPRSLAAQLKPLLADEHELNSLGYVFLHQNLLTEAVAIFRANAFLFPESGNVLSSLGEAYLEKGDMPKALSILEKSLKYAKDPGLIKTILQLLYKAKGLK